MGEEVMPSDLPGIKWRQVVSLHKGLAALGGGQRPLRPCLAGRVPVPIGTIVEVRHVRGGGDGQCPGCRSHPQAPTVLIKRRLFFLDCQWKGIVHDEC